jgi:N-methylhydantoinase B
VRDLDPLTLSVIWNGSINICEEMGLVLRRTAYSEAVREAEDYSTALYDARGRAVAQGVYTPGHLGAMFFAIQHALKAYPPETLEPGDGILLNDIYMGSGHLPDVFAIYPVFIDNRLVAFAVNCAHQLDVGGMAPGSQVVEGVLDFYQEGMRILPVRHYRNWRPVPEVMRLVIGNVRQERDTTGDLKAMMNANFVADQRLKALVDRYGLETVLAAFDEMIDRSEAATREAYRAVPEGRYSFVDYMDDYGRNTPPIRCEVAIEVRGDEITVDWTGSGPQVPAGMNSTYNFTYAYSLYAIKCLTSPNVPQNDGSRKAITVIAPKGCFFNPIPPAPGAGRAVVANRIVDTIMGAMSKALPDRAVTASSHFVNATFGGLKGSHEPFVYYELLMGGYHARPQKDGADGMASAFNTGNIPVEVQESNHPVIVSGVQFVCDSAGAGKFRGGTGIQKDLQILNDVRLSNLSDRNVYQPFGLFGGKPGSLGSTTLEHEGVKSTLHSKGVYDLHDGDRVSFRVAGAGGWGSPLTRDPQAVLRDVVDGFVSAEAAERDYGVRVNPIRRTVDEQATRSLRATAESSTE